MKPIESDNLFRQCLTGAACICFFFTALLAAMLVTTHIQLRRTDPLDSQVLRDLQATYDKQATEEVAMHIRELDVLARRAFFSSRRQIKVGSGLLVVALLLGTGCWSLAGSLGRPPVVVPSARNSLDHRWQANRTARRLLFGGAGVVAVSLGIWAAYSTLPAWIGPVKDQQGAVAASSSLSSGQTPAAGDQAASPAIDPDQAWPGFRGWKGLAKANVPGLPLTWDGATGKNLLWKVPLDLPGFSSPVIWEKQVIISAGNADRRVVTAYALETGEKIWEHPVTDVEFSPEEPPEVTDDTGYAASTPAVSADGVCAIFANGDLVCLTLQGERRWAVNLGVPENHYGHSSSLLIDSGVLFVQYDHSAEALLMAYDVRTGKFLWDVKRDSISWGSPVLITAPDGKNQLVLVNESTVRGYSPGDGSLLWEETCLGGEVAPSAAYDDGIVFVANEYARAAAVRVDSGGATEILWTWDEALPDVASPLAVNGRVWLATSAGEVACLQGETGTVLYRQEFDTGFYASPVVNDGHIYLTDLSGKTWVFSTGEVFEKLGEGSLGEAGFATPAMVKNRLVMRGETHLFCFTEK